MSMINKFTFSSTDAFSLSLSPISTSNSITGTIDWGDDTTSDYVYGSSSHSYASGGTYTVTFTTTDFEQIGYGFCANNSYLINCELDDNLKRISSGTFYGATNLKKLNVPYMAIVENSSCSNSGLEIVNFGSKTKPSVVSLEEQSSSAFVGCSNLKKINYYIDDDSLIGTTNSSYFHIDSSSCAKVLFGGYDASEEIRSMRIGSHMPSFKYLNISRDSNVIWKMALGSKIIWNLNKPKEFNEYLKVADNCIGEKFLETYFAQKITTSVYWFHEVDGEMVGTSLSVDKLNSWECDTLESYSLFNKVQYYNTPCNSGYGEHTMKITYTSPDSGNILKIEYPIYYLEEISMTMNESELDWYPFRYLWAEIQYVNCEAVFPTATLHYQCYNNNKELVQDKQEQNLLITTTKYEFPNVSNARYKFGEGQTVQLTYTSNAGKNWDEEIIVNIRPYYDERNSLVEDGIIRKDISPLTLGVTVEDSGYENQYYGSYIVSVPLEAFDWTSSTDMFNTELITEKDVIEGSGHYHYFTYRGVPCLNPVIETTTVYKSVEDPNGGTYSLSACSDGRLVSADFFESQDDFLEYLSECTYTDSNGNVNSEISYNNNTTVILDNIFSKSVDDDKYQKNTPYGEYSSFEGDRYIREESVSTIGYVYWGDGTFDIYSFNDTMKVIRYDLLSSYSTSSGNFYSQIYGSNNNATLIHGRSFNGTQLVNDYEDSTMISKSHTYETGGDYDIIITACGCKNTSIDEDDVLTLSIGTSRSGGYLPRTTTSGSNYITEMFPHLTSSEIASIRHNSQWFSSLINFTSQSKLLENADNVYRYTYDEVTQTYTFPDNINVYDGAILAESLTATHNSNYYRPTRQIIVTEPYGTNETAIKGLAIPFIMRNFKIGESLFYRIDESVNSDKHIIQDYKLDLTISASSRFKENFEIDVENLYKVKFELMDALDTIHYKGNYDDIKNALNQTYSLIYSYPINETYFRPTYAYLVNKEEKISEDYGIDLGAKLVTSYDVRLPHVPSEPNNTPVQWYIYLDDGTYKTSSRYNIGSIGANKIICNDKTTTFTDLFDWETAN
jgi:hypothetical protein